jgi:hypothetical protein
MNIITRRIAAAATLAIAPALLAVGVATASQAASSVAPTRAPPSSPARITRPESMAPTSSRAPPSTTATRTTSKPPLSRKRAKVAAPVASGLSAVQDQNRVTPGAAETIRILTRIDAVYR